MRGQNTAAEGLLRVTQTATETIDAAIRACDQAERSTLRRDTAKLHERAEAICGLLGSVVQLLSDLGEDANRLHTARGLPWIRLEGGAVVQAGGPTDLLWEATEEFGTAYELLDQACTALTPGSPAAV